MSEFRKAVIGGFWSAFAVLIAFNIPGWIDGTEAFEWRSVLAALAGGFLGGFAVYRVPNTPQDA